MLYSVLIQIQPVLQPGPGEASVIKAVRTRSGRRLPSRRVELPVPLGVCRAAYLRARSRQRRYPGLDTVMDAMETAMKEDKTGNKVHLKYSGKLMRHWYWCILLPLFLIGLTAAVLYVDTLAGAIVGGFTVVVLLTVLLLDLYYRPRVLIELVDFANQYHNVEHEMLKGSVLPQGLLQTDGAQQRRGDTDRPSGQDSGGHARRSR